MFGKFAIRIPMRFFPFLMCMLPCNEYNLMKYQNTCSILMPFVNSQYMRFFPGFDVQVTLQWVQFNEILGPSSQFSLDKHTQYFDALRKFAIYAVFPRFLPNQKTTDFNNRAFSKGTTLYLVFPVKFIVILTMFIPFSSSKATATLQMLTDK